VVHNDRAQAQNRGVSGGSPVPTTPPDDVSPGLPRSGSTTRPAGMCAGPGHIVVYGNPAFVAAFGAQSVGLPAREGMLGLPAEAFDLLDAVLREGRPLARWIRRAGEDWRLTVTPRIDFETDEPYGVSFHLRARSDLPVLARP
jgi:hypothetical protein